MTVADDRSAGGRPHSGRFEFEGREVVAAAADTVASALYRAGLRTFSRSFKYHRKRGLYCLTGDCPNCLMTVDGEPAVRTCTAPAAGVRAVQRGSGWPTAGHDALSILWRLRALLPVGFYYKSMIRPRWLWPLAERVIRRIAGLGPVTRGLSVASRERLYHHPDLLVVGGGLAGLAAACAAAERGERVVLADEGAIGEGLVAGPLRARVDALRARLGQLSAGGAITVLERATAVGLYPGPLVPIAGKDLLHLVHPGHIVVATGAVERHAVFPGSDLPGVFLARGAARLAGVHGLSPGRRIVLVATHAEGMDHFDTLRAHAARESARDSAKDSDCTVVAVVAPRALAARVPVGVEVLHDGAVVAALGRGAVRAVVVETAAGRRTIACDAVVLALGFEPRNGLLRQALGESVQGAGDAVLPGCTPAEAEASGVRAASPDATIAVALPAGERPLPAVAARGFVCLCEDVEAGELAEAFREGFRSTELLKRYTTMTMGACQGALCQSHLRAFVCSRSQGVTGAIGAIGASGAADVSRPTVARPPTRPVRLEDLAAGVRVPLEYHTALHSRHRALGAVMEWTGTWKRPSNYGDVLGEYRAVRENVSLMDVSTLGKYHVAGPDAARFLERLYPCHVADLAPGRSRYTLLLNEAGYIFDDGLVCALGDGSYYATFTSSGADAAESWLREWAEAWGLRVHIVNQTWSRSAIHVAGPRTRDLLAKLTPDAVDSAAIPYGGVRELEVAGVRCRALRVGFVGELSIEFHHPTRRSPELWDALSSAGADLGLRPHGLDALKLLRLEKGHFIVGLDTDFDSTPAKVGASWAVKMEKPEFVGRTALERLGRIPRERSLLPMLFEGERAPEEGAQLFVGGAHVGHLTSSRFSPILGKGVALGWVRHPEGSAPLAITARDTRGELQGLVTRAPFYDPHGERLRA
ncbi:MAG: (2Fe-2S)-binding protein [Thermoanaerobaculia bacterium]|nr:(2Fe-2S)-binding protein [Thermoanaerobaculia bacterium]MBP9824990.1 (2Fe-2S)-binding protein [Thermoanaerobaculia bacterium]